jgi:hypothetical protein
MTQELTQAANAIDRLLAGESVALALIDQGVTDNPVPFSMVSPGNAETLCTFSSPSVRPVSDYRQVRLTNYSAPGVAFQTDMFMIPVAGQPLRFRLSFTRGGLAVSVGGPLNANSTIALMPVSVQDTLLCLSSLQPVWCPRQVVPALASYSTKDYYYGLRAFKALTSATFSNTQSKNFKFTHVLALVGGNSTYGSTVCSFFSLMPRDDGYDSDFKFRPGDQATVTVEFNLSVPLSV